MGQNTAQIWATSTSFVRFHYLFMSFSIGYGNGKLVSSALVPYSECCMMVALPTIIRGWRMGAVPEELRHPTHR